MDNPTTTDTADNHKADCQAAFDFIKGQLRIPTRAGSDEGPPRGDSRTRFKAGQFNTSTGINPTSQAAWEFILEDPYKLSMAQLVEKFGLSYWQFQSMRRTYRQFAKADIAPTGGWAADKDHFKGNRK